MFRQVYEKRDRRGSWVHGRPVHFQFDGKSIVEMYACNSPDKIVYLVKAWSKRLNSISKFDYWEIPFFRQKVQFSFSGFDVFFQSQLKMSNVMKNVLISEL